MTRIRGVLKLKQYKHGLKKSFQLVITCLALIVIWELVYLTGVRWLGIWKAYSFPSPGTSLQSLQELAAGNILGTALLNSLRRITEGYAVSLLIGFTAGLLLAGSRPASEIATPLFLGLQTLPSICWLPFAILWYGLGEGAILFVIITGSAFSVVIAVQTGVRSIRPLYLKAAKTMGASGLQLYFLVILPAALPVIVSGLKQAWSFAWRALIAGEMLVAATGLGQVLMMGREYADINQVTGMMMIIMVLGLLVERLIFSKLEYHIRRRWGMDTETENS